MMGIVVFNSQKLFFHVFEKVKKKKINRCHGRGDITNDRVSNGNSQRGRTDTGEGS